MLQSGFMKDVRTFLREPASADVLLSLEALTERRAA
jgi:hypothetical protein